MTTYDLTVDIEARRGGGPNGMQDLLDTVYDAIQRRYDLADDEMQIEIHGPPELSVVVVPS